MPLISIFILLGMLEACRRRRRRVLTTEYRFRLFQLRDEIREFALATPDAAKTWLFTYFDSSITKTISFLPRFSMWTLIGLLIVYAGNPVLEEKTQQLERQLRKPENRIYKCFQQKLVSILLEFLMCRHLATLYCIELIVASSRVPAYCARVFNEMKYRLGRIALASPATSTLMEFAPPLHYAAIPARGKAR